MSTAIKQQPTLVRAINAWQQSIWYPITVALLCAVSGISQKEIYLPILFLLCLFTLFSALFANDGRVFFPILMMGYYALGNEDDSHLDGFDTALAEDFDTRIFWVVGLVVAVIVIIRFFRDGTFSHLKRARGTFLFGILAMDVAFLLNGCFSGTWQPKLLGYGLSMVFGFTLFYLVFFSIVDRITHDDPEQLKALTVYICVCALCTALVILVQYVILLGPLYLSGKIIKRYGKAGIPNMQRQLIRLPWGGYATNIAALMILGIPPALYLAKEHRFAPLTFSLSVVLMGAAFMTGTRSSSLIGVVIFLVGTVLCCIKGKNRKQIRLFSLVLVLGGVTALVYVDRFVVRISSLIPDLLEIFRLEQLLDFSGLEDWAEDAQDSIGARLSALKNGWDDFRAAPIFGVGFTDGSSAQDPSVIGILNHMYHLLPLQFLGSMGVVGLAALVWHLVDVVRTVLHRATVDRILLMLYPLTILVSSLTDNFFFFLNFQILYCAFLALAEHHSPPSDALPTKNI